MQNSNSKFNSNSINLKYSVYIGVRGAIFIIVIIRVFPRLALFVIITVQPCGISISKFCTMVQDFEVEVL